MIGDYINDINSYHLHMFDKHDVTTKKFDAIVEKAGKVDANYAAQIEGYCSLLGEYGKKFGAVCAMLQPEKLRLSPDKYREKLEGINTGYQNAKDTHEQEQSDYEAELYEIETVWYKKMLDKAEDYLIRSAECVVLGNFADEVTVLGVGVQIVLGIFDLDLPCDIRDIIADIKNLAETDRVRWDLIGMLALDLIGLIPVIGALKYSDEIGTLFKNADKVSVVARSTDGAGVLAKHADEAGAWLHGVKVFRYSDETAEAVASGEKLLKESGTIYESFADMMSPEDAKRYLDFLENGSREGLTSAELAGVEKADALLVSRKVEYEDVWDLRNVGDALESGLNSNLLDELANSGVKYNPEDIVAITKTADGKLVWLENGTDTAGLNHIITEHADDFLNKGITQEQIPDYVMNALENGKIVGYQGRGTGRPIYEFTYNGEIHKVAITVGNNGFIVGANPK
ncbi:hypothetical protein [Roseburia inulinivorans]|uniref:Pre-toxin TG domain-containing protein n=1 Tax=Roseburia inulinivorans TaxID=360807 RepID=A0A174EYX8_9FIRM|nr:hypothetical protein [Roseburia inulinivorans]CUO43014.1 Uncharacterised protein [Roseburia inulinivorans]